jgi:hypothetical protein
MTRVVNIDCISLYDVSSFNILQLNNYSTRGTFNATPAPITLPCIQFPCLSAPLRDLIARCVSGNGALIGKSRALRLSIPYLQLTNCIRSLAVPFSHSCNKTHNGYLAHLPASSALLPSILLPISFFKSTPFTFI